MNKPVTVVYATASLQQGGAEKQLYLLLLGLDRTRFEPHVWCYVDGAWREKIEALGIPVIVIGRGNKLLMLARTWKLLKKIKPTILHTVGVTAGILTRTAGILTGVSIIIASERSAVHIKSRFQMLLEKLLARRTTRIICNSSHAAVGYVRAKIAPEEKVTTVRNGFDLARFEAWRGSGETPAAQEASRETPAERLPRISLGYIANFRTMKNHRMLIEAAARVVSVYPDATFHLAGDGELGPSVREMLRERGLAENFRLHGTVADIRGFLDEISIYVHVSRYEGLSNAVMEAMAAGLPCIVCNIDANRELVDERNGFLVPTDDAVALADRIIELGGKPELMHELGAAGRRIILKDFSVEKMVSETREVYERALLEGIR